MAGIKPHYLIGNLPHPQIFERHGELHGRLFGPCREPQVVGLKAIILETKPLDTVWHRRFSGA